MVLYSIASFSCLGSSNLYSIYLFLFPKNPPLDFRTKKLVLTTHENLEFLLTQSKNATVKITIRTKPLNREAFQVTLWDFGEYFFDFFVKSAVRVHFLSKKKCEELHPRDVAKGVVSFDDDDSFLYGLSSAATFVAMIDWWWSNARPSSLCGFVFIVCVGQLSYQCGSRAGPPTLSSQSSGVLPSLQQQAKEFYNFFGFKIFAKQGKKMATYYQPFKGQGS